jgi:hypothetical protein
MSYINPYGRTSNRFLVNLANRDGLFNLIPDGNGNIYAISSYADSTGTTGNFVWLINSTTNTAPAKLSTGLSIGTSLGLRSKFVLYNNFLITVNTGTNNSEIRWWGFPQMSLTTYLYTTYTLTGIALKGNNIYYLCTTDFKVYSSQLAISSSNILTVSPPQLAAGGSVTPVPLFTETMGLNGKCSGQMTFDAEGALYVTTESNGVYKYNAGFTSPILPITPINIIPINIIPYYNCFLGNIVYNEDYNLLYVSNLTTRNIDLFTTSGRLVVSSYLTVTPAIQTGNRGGKGWGIVPMAFDTNNNFYYTGGSSAGDVYLVTRVICFKKDTQILTMTGYKLIQDLRKGDLVQTLKHGYVPIYKIGFSEMEHPRVEERVKDQLYKCSPDKYPEVFEDLVLTGCHSILVDSFCSLEQKEKAVELNGDLYITDDKYRLPVCLDERSSVYEVSGTHTIYHMALENDEYTHNYGIYANGLLVESTSKHFMDTITMTMME